jgi:hypothetical protein
VPSSALLFLNPERKYEQKEEKSEREKMFFFNILWSFSSAAAARFSLTERHQKRLRERAEHTVERSAGSTERRGGGEGKKCLLVFISSILI